MIQFNESKYEKRNSSQEIFLNKTDNYLNKRKTEILVKENLNSASLNLRDIKLQEQRICTCNFQNLKSLYQGSFCFIKIPNTSTLAYDDRFCSGNLITHITKTIFELEMGHVYSVSYNVNTNLKEVGFLNVIPRINGEFMLDYAGKNVNTKITKSISTSASFLVNTCKRKLYLDFFIITNDKFIDGRGSVSIYQIL